MLTNEAVAAKRVVLSTLLHSLTPSCPLSVGVSLSYSSMSFNMLPNSVLNSLLLFAKVISSHFGQLALRFGLPTICYCPGCGYCFSNRGRTSSCIYLAICHAFIL